MATFDLKIITPEGVAFDQAVTSATLPGSEGQFGVLPGHAPLLATLSEGVLRVVANQTTQEFQVSNGFAKVDQKQCQVLVERAV